MPSFKPLLAHFRMRNSVTMEKQTGNALAIVEYLNSLCSFFIEEHNFASKLKKKSTVKTKIIKEHT